MIYEIKPIAEDHVEGFHEVLDAVAREKRFLAYLEAPPLDETKAFVLKNIKEEYPRFVVLIQGRVAGWCDVLPNVRRVVQAHCGTLGVGLLPVYRGRGIGYSLIRQTIEAALAYGLTRIDLTVREDNVNAIALYKKIGIEAEGLHRRAFRVDGRYENVLSMAFVRDGSGDR